MRPCLLVAFLVAVVGADTLWAQVQGRWEVVPSPNGGAEPGGNTLLAVAAISPADAWAVGFHHSTTYCTTCPAPLAMHWDGAAWSLVTTPAIPRPKVQLNAVDAASSDDVWAVGYAHDDDCGLCTQTLIEHWDGTAWSVVPSPNPGLANSLFGVAAVSASDVWAVGDQWLSYSTKIPLILHYDGAIWTPVAYPPVDYGQLDSVFALAHNDVWAVGVSGVISTGLEAIALHWDGTSWTRTPVPNEPGGYIWFRSVSGVASDDVWAVGVYKYINYNGHSISSARAWHWDGASWTRTLYPGVAGQDSRMYGVHAVASNDVWAVGGGDPPIGSDAAFIYQTVHWDGVAWSDVENPRQGVLYAVSASSSSDVWAVGFGMDSLAYSTGTHTLRYQPPCPADYNGDGFIDGLDYDAFNNDFEAGDPAADINGDGFVDGIDYDIFNNAFEAGC